MRLTDCSPQDMPFDDGIVEQINRLKKQRLCRWCSNPERFVHAKGLCGSCYKTHRRKVYMDEQIAQLPPTVVRDPYSSVRREARIVDEIVELCKIEGEIFQTRMEATSPLDLEEEFDRLSCRLLGSQTGARLFQTNAHFFYNFSPVQRIWLWYLLSKINGVADCRERRAKAKRNLLDCR
jgi:hypothetical protein